MRVCVLVNDIPGLEPTQTTTLLLERLAADGHEAFVAPVGALELSPEGRLELRGTRVRPRGDASPPKWLYRVRRHKPERLQIQTHDVLLVRLNPARDPHRAWAHETALALLRDAESRGVLVLNSPSALFNAGHKLYLHRLPERWRPKTLITRDPKRIRAFLAAEGCCVVKPVTGTRGRDVFKLDAAAASNLNQMVDVLVREGYAMVQSWAQGAEAGDTRILMLEGRMLEVDGRVAAVQRVPRTGDFRSNIHAGGEATPAVITDAMRQLCAEIGPMLHADGVFLAGLDIIGDKVVEINAWAPGGFQDANRMMERDFLGAVIAAIAARQAGMVGAS